MKLKRYWLFGGEQFYASGGFNDFIDAFDEIEAAKLECDRMEALDEDYFQWWQIVDSVTGEVVLKSQYDPYGSNTGYQHRYKIRHN